MRGIPEEAASRMATVVKGEGVERLASKVGEVAWAVDLTPAADGVAEEDLPFMVGGEEDEAQDILRKARTGARHMAVAMG